MAKPQEYIEIQGAKVHNLKNIDVKIPRDKLVVITGLSGSGKSSLAFDTIYAEGQRRYIETFSAYARQFLGGLERPDVDKIDGLSPVIAIEQKTTSKSTHVRMYVRTHVRTYVRTYGCTYVPMYVLVLAVPGQYHWQQHTLCCVLSRNCVLTARRI